MARVALASAVCQCQVADSHFHWQTALASGKSARNSIHPNIKKGCATMGILESVATAILSKTGASPDQQQGILASVCELINHPDTGGLQGLVEKFKAAGLGHIADGWVSKGPNPPVSADQLQQVFSSDQLRGFAQKLGVDPDAAAKHLADILPHVVDHLTPDGKLPEGGIDTSSAIAMLKKKFFG